MKRMITLALTLALTLSLAAPAFAQETERESPFGDVASDHWAFEYISLAYEENVISGVGYDQETHKPLFTPDNTLTSAEFATIVTQAFYWRELRSDETGPEQDDLEAAYPGVEPWYAVYARIAERAGLAEGTGIEDWNAPMTRYQMAQMLYNIAVGQSLFVTSDEETLDAATIGDWEQVPEQYQSAVLRTYLLGLLSGVDERGTFAGDRSLTRAQAAVIYCRLEEALLAVQGPMERVLEKAERQMAVWGTPSYEFTRYPGLKGTLYVGVYLGTPHGSSTNMVFVYEDGRELNIRALLPRGYRLSDYLSPTEIQFDETGEKLIFITPVEEGIPNENPGPDNPSLWLETKDWGPTRCTVNLVSGTTESMEPLTPVDLPEWSVTYRPDDPLTPTADLSMTLRNDGEAAGERPYIDGGGFPSSYMYVDAHQGGIRVYNEAGLFDEDFDDSEYGKAYHALIDLKLPDITHDNFSPVNTREQREQAGQYFQVLLNGVPVSGDLWWSQGNNHKDLNFTFDQPVALKYGDTLTLRLGMPQEEQT